MSIFPMIQPTTANNTTVELPTFREVSWDYEKNTPLFANGEPVIVTEKEAIKVWIWKALHTVRYRHQIYSTDYGSELEILIGQSYTPALKEAEAPRYLKECLMINPYITAVRDVSVEFVDDILIVNGIAETIYGEVTIHAAF